MADIEFATDDPQRDDCNHQHVLAVCIRCGEPMPAPWPGWEYDEQDWGGWRA